MVADGADLDARGEAQYGAWLCGAVLAATTMSLHHKLCHTLGGTLDLPHAQTHTVVLPHALAYNAPAAPDAVAALSRALGGAEDPARELWELAGRLGAPRSLRELGMAEDDIGRITDLAVANPYANPRPVTRDGIELLLRAAWAGDQPTEPDDRDGGQPIDVGFAGLGRMGRPMARHLAAAGHRVVAYDPAVHADAVPTDLATAGVRVTDDPRRLGRAEVSLSMLPDAAATEALLFGEHGLLGGCGASHVHVVMGTVGPAAVRALAEKTRAAGVALVDAPRVRQRQPGRGGEITAMVGAEPAVFEAVRPVLAAMTRAQFRTGPVGSGSAAKLAVNLALASLNQAIAEALAVATADGLDPAVFYDVLEASAVSAPTSRTSARRS